VRLAVRSDRGRLTIEVRDDGPGPSAVTSMGSGIGLANTRERLRHLYDDDHHFDMRLRDSTGTIVTLDIPLRKS
jgi:sensor histidine kinase YesM